MIEVGGKLVPARCCRDCLHTYQSDKMFPEADMTFMRGGWYCAKHVAKRRAGAKAAAARMAVVKSAAPTK